MNVSEEIQRISELSDGYVAMIGHPIRLVILKSIYENKVVTWTEIAKATKKLWPDINPNTVTFHINKLLQHNVIQRTKDNRYKLAPKAQESTIVVEAIGKMK